MAKAWARGHGPEYPTTCCHLDVPWSPVNSTICRVGSCARMSAENPCSKSRGFKESLQLSNTCWMPHFAQGLCFNLTNALAGNLELPAYFFQGPAVSINQPKSLFEHLPLPIGQRLQHVLDFLLQQNNRSHVARVFGASVLDKVAEICFFALAYRGLERDWLLRHLQDRANTIHWQEHFFGNFVRRRFSPIFLHQLFLYTHELVNRLNHVDGNSNRARLVRDGAGDGLANPPRRVSGKFVAPPVFEFLDCLH